MYIYDSFYCFPILLNTKNCNTHIYTHIYTADETKKPKSLEIFVSQILVHYNIGAVLEVHRFLELFKNKLFLFCGGTVLVDGALI